MVIINESKKIIICASTRNSGERYVERLISTRKHEDITKKNFDVCSAGMFNDGKGEGGGAFLVCPIGLNSRTEKVKQEFNWFCREITENDIVKELSY